MCQIAGGADQLPCAFLPALGHRIRYGARMVAIDQTPDEVIIHYQTRVGRFEARGDYAILTVPFPVLRHVEVLKPFSRAKQRAIRQLHYDASAKIFFQTRRRFWEEDDGIYGGGTVTDLAIRNLYYTDYGMISTCPTLILLMLVILFAEAIAATVVACLIAMTVSVSPDFTV